MEEPSVLDYLKSKIFFWRGISIEIPDPGEEFTAPIPGEESPTDMETGIPVLEVDQDQLVAAERFDQETRQITDDLAGIARLLIPLVLAFFGQIALAPPSRHASIGVFFFMFSAAGLVWLYERGDLVLPVIPSPEVKLDQFEVKNNTFTVTVIALVSGLGAFYFLGNNIIWSETNQFTFFNTFLWGIAGITTTGIFWKSRLSIQAAAQTTWRRVTEFLRKGISFSPWTLSLMAVFIVSIFFRLYQLNAVPVEMTSDHAEKLLDVADVVNGKYSIFFPRNAGREAFQMYLDALVSRIFGTGISFLTLKIGTAIPGLLTLPFMYLIGKELGNKRVGLWAMFFAGISYWANVNARVGLRFPFYPLFTAILFYFLIRGFKYHRRNDFILAGITLGFSLYGYTAARILPFLVIAAFVLVLLHRRKTGTFSTYIFWFLIVVLLSAVVFLPLLRYSIDEPEMIAYRSMSRLSGAEQPLPGPVLQVFFHNLWNGLRMFSWSNGGVWLASIPDQPALGVVTGGLFMLGLVIILLRYLRERDWFDLFLVLSIPILLLPSILSLAFPGENPNLYRTGGAIIPVFLLVGYAFDSLWSSMKTSARTGIGRFSFAGIIGFILMWSVVQNYNLVFNQYADQYLSSTWNSSQMGEVIHQYTETVGSEDTAFVVPFPHWVDTRLVAMNAGFPDRDFARWADDLESTLDDPRNKLFLVKFDDAVTLDKLKTLYPTGSVEGYDSGRHGKDFWIFYAPAQQ